jgi:phenylalanyl-tRNA synthetase beta chain
MKVIYSELKKLLPDLHSDYQKLRDDLTLIGHFASGYEEIDGEQIYDLEIRQNRGDCLGYYGVAKDLSVFYNTPLITPTQSKLESGSKYDLPITVKAQNDVKRVLAIKITNSKVAKSPDWLKKFLKLHDINSINNIVDLTNYVMLVYGIPCHAFDTKKTTDNLIWEINGNRFQKFTTLDGTVLDLEPENLIISNSERVLSLSFIGGNNSGITEDTTEIILEMAIYNRSRVRKDSRNLRTITEASVRLDKDLDTELIPEAFSYLVKLIQDNASGQIVSNIFESYNVKPVIPTIEFDPKKPSAFAGIDIPTDFSIDVLKRLGCQLKQNDNVYLVNPPSIRKDITLEEDLIEEVIRFWGYNKIPLNEPISSEVLPDITPPVLYLNESLANILVSLGYDEVRSWPLIQEKSQIKELQKPDELPIFTQNSINSEYPLLRQNIISSLRDQYDQYNRYKLPVQKFFEIGKVFHQNPTGEYCEHYALGIFNKLEADFKLFDDILKNKLKINVTPMTLNNFTGNYYEYNLNEIVNTIDVAYLKENNLFENEYTKKTTAYELTGQLITLDANVTFDSEQDPLDLINLYSQKIDKNILWQVVITDIYQDIKTGKFRYTFRVTYFNTDDKTAKKVHLESFGLNTL